MVEAEVVIAVVAGVATVVVVVRVVAVVLVAVVLVAVVVVAVVVVEVTVVGEVVATVVVVGVVEAVVVAVEVVLAVVVVAVVTVIGRVATVVVVVELLAAVEVLEVIVGVVATTEGCMQPSGWLCLCRYTHSLLPSMTSTMMWNEPAIGRRTLGSGCRVRSSRVVPNNGHAIATPNTLTTAAKLNAQSTLPSTPPPPLLLYKLDKIIRKCGKSPILE